MTEQNLRKKARELCDLQGHSCWFAPRVRYSKQQDIFGMFDMIGLFPDGTPFFVQITTIGHKSHRELKIQELSTEYPLPKFAYIWAWDDRIKTFKVFEAYYGKK